jgi:hypothetical protein
MASSYHSSGPWRPKHYSEEIPAALFNMLYAAAEAGAHGLAHAVRQRMRRHVGATLRPGPGTPLWNTLVDETLPLLRRRGSKAQLARILGVPRQRLQDCLKARTACLDAERTLLLLCWVSARQQGRRQIPL